MHACMHAGMIFRIHATLGGEIEICDWIWKVITFCISRNTRRFKTLKQLWFSCAAYSHAIFAVYVEQTYSYCFIDNSAV